MRGVWREGLRIGLVGFGEDVEVGVVGRVGVGIGEIDGGRGM